MTSLLTRFFHLRTKSTIGKCPQCGTTLIKYDPPVKVEWEESCGVMKPGTYTTGSKVPIPFCVLAKGHEGKHWDLIDYEETWT